MSTISKRIVDAIKAQEHLIWMHLKDDSSGLISYLANRCVMIFPDGEMLSDATEPSLRERLASNSFPKWQTYSLNNIEIIEVDLMAAIIYYTATATRINN